MSGIRENIRKARKEKGLKQSDLAKESGLSSNAIGNYERGTRRPSAETLKKIAQALDIPIQNLFGQGYEEIRKPLDKAIRLIKSEISYKENEFLMSTISPEKVVYDKGFLDGMKLTLELLIQVDKGEE